MSYATTKVVYRIRTSIGVGVRLGDIAGLMAKFGGALVDQSDFEDTSPPEHRQIGIYLIDSDRWYVTASLPSWAVEPVAGELGAMFVDTGRIEYGPDGMETVPGEGSAAWSVSWSEEPAA